MNRVCIFLSRIDKYWVLSAFYGYFYFKLIIYVPARQRAIILLLYESNLYICYMNYIALNGGLQA